MTTAAVLLQSSPREWPQEHVAAGLLPWNIAAQQQL